MEPQDHKAAIEDFARKPEVTQQLNQAVQLVADVRDEARAEVDKIRAGLIPQRDTAAELKAQRDWQRQKEYLDASANEAERVARARGNRQGDKPIPLHLPPPSRRLSRICAPTSSLPIGWKTR